MNQQFDEKFLSDFRELPPEEFAHQLYQQLQQQDADIKILHSPSKTSHSSQSPIRLLEWSNHTLKFAAVLSFILFTTILAVALHWSGQSNDQANVQVESIQDETPSTNPQNAPTLTEVNRFGTGSLQKFVWSPDNQKLAAITTTGMFIYDQNLDLQLQIDTESPVNDARFNPIFDDTLAIVQGGKVLFHQINREGSTTLSEISPSSGAYMQIRWLPDGTSFVAANSNGSVDVFSDGAVVFSQNIVGNDESSGMFLPPRFDVGVIGMDINFDGTQLVTVGSDAAVKVWTIGNAGELTPLAEMTSDFPIFSYVTFALNDNRLVVAQDSLSVYEIDETGFTLLQSLAVESPFNAWDANVSFDTSGEFVFFGAGSPQQQQIWHLPSNTTRTLATASENGNVFLGSPVYSPDGELLATLNGDKTLFLWSIHQVTDRSFLAEEIASDTPVSGSFLHMAISSQDIVAAAQLDGTIILFDGNSGEMLIDFNLGTLPNKLTFSPDGDMLVIFGFDSTGFRGSFSAALVSSILTQTVNAKTSHRFLESGELLSGIAFNADQTVMITGGTSLKFWDISGETVVQHPDYVGLQETMLQNAEFNSEMGSQINLVAISPNGEFIAGMAGNILNIWDAQTGELRFSHYRRDFNQLLLEFTTDSQYVMTANGSEDPAIRFWDVNGNEVASLPLPEGYLYATLSPDKTTFITITTNGIQAWNIEDVSSIGDPVDITPSNLAIDPSMITSLQAEYSADGQHLLMRWADATLRLFKIEE